MNNSSEVPIIHLQRRKIEGRVLLPLLRTLKEKFGEEVMHDVLDTTISRLAAEDGAAWAASHGQTIAGLRRVALEVWAGSGALDVQLVGESADHLDFNVTRCRYAEFYRDQGLRMSATTSIATAILRWSQASTTSLSSTEAKRSCRARRAATSDFAGRLPTRPDRPHG
jgi:L-2-amino-thiazoline-4-carboxylic acid hydrolase